MKRRVPVTQETLDKIMTLLRESSDARFELYRLMAGGRAPEQISESALKRRYKRNRKVKFDDSSSR